ncbi:acetylxylan esterase [Planctomycetota bacterium]|nr:acetylxylan esterase [Planctomycetota bacterium]
MRSPAACLVLGLAVCAFGPAHAQDGTPRADLAAQLTGHQPALPVLSDLGADADALAVYQVPEERFTINLGPADVRRMHTQREVVFPSAIKTRWPEVHGTLYAPRHAQPGDRIPAAVVVHHLGGSFEVEAYMAQFLAQHGIMAFFISLPNYGNRQEPGTSQGFISARDPLNAPNGFRQAVLDVIRAGDLLRAMPEVDSERVGVLGVSLGSFVCSVARGVDPRLRRSVLILGGGDLGSVVRTADEVREVLDKSGVDPEELAEALLPYDPITFAGRVPTEDVLMINASQDEVVPPSSTRALWHAFGEPEIHWFATGHYGMALHIPWVMTRALDHLRGRTAH